MKKTTILGNVPSKSNCYRIIKKGKNSSLGKTAKLRAYERSFCLQASRLANVNIDCEFKFVIDVYYDSKRPDLDNSFKVILDCLQKIKCIKNDNKCVEIQARKFKDAKNPRINFEIIKVPNWDYL